MFKKFNFQSNQIFKRFQFSKIATFTWIWKATVKPLHSQPFIASNRPKQGIKLGLKLLILATCDPNGDQMKVAFHQ